MKKLLAVLTLALAMAGCGGGGGSSAPAAAPPAPVVTSNTVPVVVDSTFGTANAPYVSVTICVPGTQSCATVDHVLLDTGSTGLRLLKSAVPTSLALPSQTDAASGNPLAECEQFGGGFTWGPILKTDVKMSGETASAIPLQVIDDTFAAIPTNCSNLGQSLGVSGTASLHANGLLGISVLREDCGIDCQNSSNNSFYYACAGTVCNTVAVPLASQVPNPITKFAADNNGASLALQAIPAAGAVSATGTLTFGIGTQTDNALGSATTLTTSSTDGSVAAVYKGASAEGFLDSGSSALFIPDASIPICPAPFAANDWLCPPSGAPLSLSALLTGVNGTSTTANFEVANAQTALTSTNFAFDNIGIKQLTLFGSVTVDLGLPFFYGKTIFFGIQGNDELADGTAPFFAIQL